MAGLGNGEPDWKALALWLAYCHAATAEYDGMLKSTSKARKRRLQDICGKAHHAMTTGVLNAGRPVRQEDAERRLLSAKQQLDFET